MENSRDTLQLVTIGASAGGIDALCALVSGLPADFPAAIVIAQHLDPRSRSHLNEILAARCPLAVKTVVSEDKLEPGTIFVVPCAHQVEITENRVRVTPVSADGPQPSVDHLFESAARAF